MKCELIPGTGNHVSAAKSALILLKMVSGNAGLLLWTKYGQRAYNAEHYRPMCSVANFRSLPFTLIARDIF